MKPAHTRVTWSGIFGEVAAPIEIWQMSLNLGEGVFADQTERESVAAAMRAAWSTHISGQVLPVAKLTRTRVAQVGADGLVLKGASGEYLQADNDTLTNGSGNGNSHPLQTALCVSLTTDRSGPSGKGRFYLPAPAFTLGLDGRIPPAQVTPFLEKAKSFVEAVDAAYSSTLSGTTPGGNVIVASTKGFASVVTGVKVGRVPDTQRRRRGDLLEEYVTAVVNTGG